MAKTAKIVKVKNAPASVVFTEDEDALETLDRASLDQVEDSNKLADFMEQFGGKEYKVRLDKFNKEEKVWEHVDTFPVDGFEAYETCKRFGGGRYRLTFLNEKGKYIPGGSPQIRIAASVLPATAATVAPVDADPLKHPMVVMMMGFMEKSNNQATELLRAVLSKPEPAKSSTLEVFELMDKLNRMRPDDPMKKVSEAVMMKMIEKGLDGGGDSGEKSTWQEIVEGLKDAKEMGVFNHLLGGGNRAPVRKATTQPIAPNAPAAPASVSVQLPLKEPAAVANPLHDALRPYAVIFKNKAEAGVDAAEAGAYLVDEIYDSIIPIIRKNVAMAKFMSDQGIIEFAAGNAQDPEQIEKLYAFAPELEPHKAWVSLVIIEAVKIVTTPEENATSQTEAAPVP